jgi:hypothetical protein
MTRRLSFRVGAAPSVDLAPPPAWALALLMSGIVLAGLVGGALLFPLLVALFDAALRLVG